MSGSEAHSAEALDGSDRAEVEQLLSKLEEMVSICSHLVDTLAGGADTFVDGPASDPFYGSTFD